jgi:hypothetical protein
MATPAHRFLDERGGSHVAFARSRSTDEGNGVAAGGDPPAACGDPRGHGSRQDGLRKAFLDEVVRAGVPPSRNRSCCRCGGSKQSRRRTVRSVPSGSRGPSARSSAKPHDASAYINPSGPSFSGRYVSVT